MSSLLGSARRAAIVAWSLVVGAAYPARAEVFNPPNPPSGRPNSLTAGPPRGRAARPAVLRVGSQRAPWSERLRLTGAGLGREESGRVAAGFRFGYVTDLRKTASPAALAVLSVRLPFGAERLELGAEVGKWSRKLSEDEAGDMVTRSVKVMPVRTRLLYQVPVASLSLFAGVGCGVVLTRSDVASPGAMARARSRTPAAGALVGARLRAGRGRFGVEVGWWHAPVDETELRGAIGGLELSGGYALSF